MTYRATPITQRDGSALANSNCRMAAGSTGLDYHTLGAETSTGAEMRSRQSDQSGGTDSGDLDRAWATYDRDLRVMDGHSWADALADLKAGRLIHLDVWHASVGGPCLSSSGSYGHTMAVAPEKDGSRWLVADPWCNPPKWSWVEESKLRAGAEEWGSQVFQATGGEPGWKDATPAERRVILARVVRRLMTRAHPGAEHPEDETGGSGGPILYTTTKVQEQAAGGGDVGIYWSVRLFEDPGIELFLDSGLTDHLTTTTAGGTLTQIGARAVQDANGYDNSAVAVLVNTGHLRDDGEKTRAIAWCRKSDLGAEIATDNAWDDSAWALLLDPNGRYPSSAPSPDCDAALAARDAEWVAWVMDGAPAGDVAG